MIFRNPRASHCVQKFPLDLYRPSSAVLASGWMMVTTSSVNWRGTRVIVSPSASTVYSDGASARPSSTSASSSRPMPSSRSDGGTGAWSSQAWITECAVTIVRSSCRSNVSSTESTR